MPRRAARLAHQFSKAELEQLGYRRLLEYLSQALSGIEDPRRVRVWLLKRTAEDFEKEVEQLHPRR